MIGSQLKLGFSLACALIAALALPSLAKDKGVPLETEQDQSALQTAESACAVRDFTLLLEAMAASDAVVRRYSAPEISVLVDGVVKPIAREEYRDFPLGMLEYSWISRASMLAWDRNPNAELEDLDVELNQSQSDWWRVDFAPVSDHGSASSGEAIGGHTTDGYLLFEPTADCWQLVEQNSDTP